MTIQIEGRQITSVDKGYINPPDGAALLDLKDKTVAVIGTGASAIQFVPEIAKEVKQLYVFQRTAPWIVPRPDKEVSAAMKQRFKRFPFLQNQTSLVCPRLPIQYNPPC